MNYLKKNKSGAVLPFALVLISLVSAITFSAYKMVEEQSITAVDSNMKDVTYQAAESAIQEVLDDYNIEDDDGLKTLSNVGTDEIVRCVTNKETIILSDDSSCRSSVNYGNEDIISESRTKRADSLCLTWGNSDKSIKCFQIKGVGELAKNKLIKTENVQEIQIIEIKQEDNGIYEF